MIIIMKNIIHIVKSGSRIALFAVLTIVSFLIAVTPIGDSFDISEIEGLPDYDYIAEIKDLRNEGRLMEAEQLADFVLENCNVSTREDVRSIREEIEKERTALWHRAWRGVKGFVVGEGHSVEELGGSVISDMLLWGDVRDLVKQGYYKWTGKETDPVIAALAGLGLVTECIDAVDWAPAVFKSLRKVGSLSKKFCDFLLTQCRRTVKTKKIDKELKVAVEHLGKLYKGAGISRTACIMKHVDDVRDLEAVAKIAKQSPEAVAIVVRTDGKNAMRVIKGAASEANGASWLTKMVKKGPATVTKITRATKIGCKKQWLELLSKFIPAVWLRLIFASIGVLFGYVTYRKVKNLKKGKCNE